MSENRCTASVAKGMGGRLLLLLSSARFALVLVCLIALFSVAGAMLPQVGTTTPEELRQWQNSHSWIDAIVSPLGLYNVFQSWGFLVVLVALGVNTLTCTVLHGVQNRHMLVSSIGARVHWMGFVLLHLSLVLLIVGGFVSGATRLSGRVVLIEGQTFDGRSRRYSSLAEGPLRSQSHVPLAITLHEVRVVYEQQRISKVSSSLTVRAGTAEGVRGEVLVNRPLVCDGVRFIQDLTGYAPRLVIRDKMSGEIFCSSFIALKAARTGTGLLHRDFLPLPFLDRRIIITLYPSHRFDGGDVVRTGESPESPLLVIEAEDGEGRASAYVRLGEQVGFGDHTYAFTSLRRWSSLGVAQDAGYLIVCIAFWGGLVGLVLRYLSELSEWLREDAHDAY